METVMNVTNSTGHCSQDALTGAFGWLLQLILASLAFTCLIFKRFCEPKYERRPWIIWFYDTSKQVIGSLVIHMTNIILASDFQGDPCTWYVIHFLLDSSLGLFLIYLGIRYACYLAKRNAWSMLDFGEYGNPPSYHIWLSQCCLYVFLLLNVKVVITFLMKLQFWSDVSRFILSPITNPQAELAIVMLIIPFFVNAIQFWITDDILMHQSRHFDGILTRMKIRYRQIVTNPGSRGGGSRDVLGGDFTVSDDDDDDDDEQNDNSEQTQVSKDSGKRKRSDSSSSGNSSTSVESLSGDRKGWASPESILEKREQRKRRKKKRREEEERGEEEEKGGGGGGRKRRREREEEEDEDQGGALGSRTNITISQKIPAAKVISSSSTTRAACDLEKGHLESDLDLEDSEDDEEKEVNDTKDDLEEESDSETIGSKFRRAAALPSDVEFDLESSQDGEDGEGEEWSKMGAALEKEFGF
uniref:Store-operated calcium entry regulator STIMATE n=1 Tax=Cacopsylla melanoneura TaxID=428564 RepID=A0A8D8S2Y0_9HEMI